MFKKNPFGRRKESEKRSALIFKERQHLIQHDIYSMAYCALLDPKIIYKQLEGCHYEEFLHPIPLTDDETSRIYLGALMVVGIQATMVVLLIYDMMKDKAFETKAPTNFLIVIPRLVSSIMMHLIVEPDIRNGISLMKYSVNHAGMFKGVKNSSLAIIPPFFLGFVQMLMGIITEYMVLFYLSTLTYIFDIIMKFAALTFIVSVDNIYANALFENKMKDSAGKKLIVVFKRYMKSLNEQ